MSVNTSELLNASSSEELLVIEKSSDIQIAVWVSCGFTSLMCLYIAMLQIGYRLLQSTRSMVILSFLAMTGITEVCYVIGATSTEDSALCTTMAALFHFCCISCFTWFLSYVLFLANKLYSRNRSPGLYAVIGWGIPACFVIISLVWKYKDYRQPKVCWISASLDWVMKGPIVAFSIVTLIILIYILSGFYLLQQRFSHSVKLKRIGVDLITCIILLPIMCAVWLLSVFSVTHNQVWIQVLFAALNITLGFLLFGCMCLFNQEVKQAREKYTGKTWKERFGLKKDTVKHVGHPHSLGTKRAKMGTRTHVLFPLATTSGKVEDENTDETDNEVFRISMKDDLVMETDPSFLLKPIEPPDKPETSSTASVVAQQSPSTTDSASQLIPLATIVSKRQDETTNEKLPKSSDDESSKASPFVSYKPLGSPSGIAPIAQTESDEDNL